MAVSVLLKSCILLIGFCWSGSCLSFWFLCVTFNRSLYKFVFFTNYWAPDASLNLTSRVITFTKITWIVPRFSVVHYFCLILSYDDSHAIHGHLSRLPRAAIDVFQAHVLWPFIFATRKLIGRFGAMRVAGSGELDLLRGDQCRVESRLAGWCA